MQRWIVGVAIGVAATYGATLYARQPAPQSALGDAVGVGSPRPFSRFCSWFVRDTPFGTWPTGSVACTWYRKVGPERRPEHDDLNYDVATRRVSQAGHSWEPLSHFAWRRAVDSVRTRLRALGGVAACAAHSWHRDDEIREFWRFQQFDIQLFTGRDASQLPREQRRPRWFVFINGEPSGRIPC